MHNKKRKHIKRSASVLHEGIRKSWNVRGLRKEGQTRHFRYITPRSRDPRAVAGKRNPTTRNRPGIQPHSNLPLRSPSSPFSSPRDYPSPQIPAPNQPPIHPAPNRRRDLRAWRAMAGAGAAEVERAHKLYRGGRHREALELYSAALAAARAPAQRIALHSNRAACYLKLHDFHKVRPAPLLWVAFLRGGLRGCFDLTLLRWRLWSLPSVRVG